MIKIDNLGFSYGSNPVLEHITMTLEDGRIYGLLGENGVGKTTLLTLLSGLKKPQTGAIVTDGFTPYDRKPSFLQEQYYLPDEVAPLNWTARRFARERGVFWPNFSLDKFVRILEEFEVDPEQKMNRMSAGQLKKTYISFALALGVLRLLFLVLLLLLLALFRLLFFLFLLFRFLQQSVRRFLQGLCIQLRVHFLLMLRHLSVSSLWLPPVTGVFSL